MSDVNEKMLNDIVALVRASNGLVQIKDAPFPAVLVPQGYTLASLEAYVFNEHAEKPQRIKAHPQLLDVASFVEYYNHFVSDDAETKVFADEGAAKVTAILDYHTSAIAPKWGHHRLTLGLRHSEEWETWNGSNGTQMTQMAFAEFLEQNAMDITSPAPADILEVARDLQAHTEVSFGSGVRAQDGRVQFRYTEEIKATVGGGAIAVPESFVVTLPVFVGGVPVDLRALLRYRVKEGKLAIWYTLVRPEAVVREAFKQTRDQIAAQLDIVILNGAPSA
jgi:uncharacterized protein YfdQ (DUF2303 family)